MYFITTFFSSKQTKMVEYIECYPEYQKFEEFLRCLIRLLNFSCISRNTIKRYAKFISTIFLLYGFLTAAVTVLYYEQDLTLLLLRIIPTVGYWQLIAKSLSLHGDSKELEILFQCFQQFHRVHQVSLITDTSRIHLKKSLKTIKIILRCVFKNTSL